MLVASEMTKKNYENGAVSYQLTKGEGGCCIEYGLLLR